MEAKHVFEKYAATFGVKNRRYHAGNGAFNTRIFKESIFAANKTITFSVVDAHHQNLFAYRIIMTVTYCARSILLNSIVYWIDVIQT